MDLSIIILNWNTKELLLACLKSVFRYTKKIKFEVIVCDNGSSDGSIEAVKKMIHRLPETPPNFRQVQDGKADLKRPSGSSNKKRTQNITLIRNNKNLGFAAGNNPGLRQAKGRYLLLLNSDTKIDYDVFTKMVIWMDQYEDIGILGPRRLNRDKTLQMNGVGDLPSLWSVGCNLVLPLHAVPYVNFYTPAIHKRYLDFYGKTQKVGWVTGSCFMIRNEVYKQIGGFDEKIFMYVEELEYCKRAQVAGWEVWYLADEYIWHLERGSSISGKQGAILGIYKGLKYYFRKHCPAWQLPALICLLKLGALIRLLRAPRVYWRAFWEV